MRWPVASVLIGLVHFISFDASAHSATLVAAQGEVAVRAPKASQFASVASGATIASGSRLKTGTSGSATLKFADGTETKVRPKTQIIVRAAKKEEKSGLTVFFGRVWTSVVKRVGGDTAFEVHSANAVAGVRGTEFEVGVADDGSTRVIVTRGKVDVGGDGEKGPVNIAAGFEIESGPQGGLARRRKAKRNANWEGWFAKRAKVLVKRGTKVAKNLDGRLNRRKAKLERLLGEQRQLRDRIVALERKQKMGADVGDELKSTLSRLERVTERIEDMQARLQAAFGLFERWGDVAEAGMVNEPATMKRMAGNIRKIAADFADMIEEGTDLSEEGMDDMMKEMEKGGTLRPKKGGAKDELFE
ncbi:MAG: FecR domain-containing protein [Deltaproteobacteria bacterium]